MKIRKVIDIILSAPKTVFVNFTLLPLNSAIYLPIWVNWKTKIDGIHGKVILDTVRTGIVRIGFGGSFSLGGGVLYQNKWPIENKRFLYNGARNSINHFK